MPENSAPSWGDHPLPDRIPEAWAAVVSMIRAEIDRYGGGDRLKIGTWSWALTVLSLRPAGDWCFPRHAGATVRPTVAFAAPPEFVPFADLDGHRTGYVGDHRSSLGYLGWVVPAPELARADHPVGLVDYDAPTVVSGLGSDTRAGLARYFDLLGYHDLPWWLGMDSAYGSYQEWVRKIGTDIEKVVRALGLEFPDEPPKGYWTGGRPAVDVPPGWRHEPGADGVGVVAPADAFAAGPPATPRPSQPIVLDQVVADAERLLGAGAPASALLLVKNVFARGEERRQGRRSQEEQRLLAALKPLWARAYIDLGRPQLVDRLELVASDGWRS